MESALDYLALNPEQDIVVNREEYWKKIAELKKRLDDAKRQMKPEDPEADLWVSVHDTDTGQVTWFPKALYDELQNYHMLARGIGKKRDDEQT